VLLGNVNEKTERFGHAEMPVFGAGKDIASRTWQSVYRQLLAMGLMRVDHAAFGALKLDEGARAVFKREREVFFRKDRPASERRPKKAAQAERQVGACRLGRSCSRLAPRAERGIDRQESLGVPPYVVFPDTTLIAFATEPRPQDSSTELLGISGVGPIEARALWRCVSRCDPQTVHDD
jgi:ATP-dependent DNA helicase RecQ